jgi:hydrogenase expression/formation protein HypC
MCLAVPAEIVAIETDEDCAIVSFGGVRKRISLALVDDAAPGDYVLVHVGFALAKVSPEEAARTLELMAEAGLIGLEPGDAASGSASVDAGGTS